MGEANGRVYDPLTAMFFSPDPFVQAPDNWLNYNRYAYGFGNPMKYTDPDGECIHLVVGAVVGGVINWASNGCEFTWEGLSYFGTGAVAGLITAAAPGSYALVAAGLSATNSVFQQGYDPGIGFKNINFQQVLFQGAMGGVTAYAGGEFGKALQVDKWVKGIESPLLRLLTQNLITNTIVGGTFGGLSSVSNGGDFWEGAWSGVKMGMVTGAISGLGGAVTYAKENNVNILTGKNIKVTNEATYSSQVIDKMNMTDDDFVHVTTADAARNILNEGFNEGGYVTKWRYVKDVSNGYDFETMLYKQEYWTSPKVVNKFSNGFEILKLDGRPSFYSPRTNWVNGVPQWRFYQGVPTSNIFLIK